MNETHFFAMLEMRSAEQLPSLQRQHHHQVSRFPGETTALLHSGEAGPHHAIEQLLASARALFNISYPRPMAEFKKRLRQWLPTAQTLEQTRGFAWLGHYLRAHPRLWVLHRRGVALGVALGIGIGVFPVPLQMPAAMLAAVALRANVAAAAAATWLTNPFTMAPIWGFSAFLGSFVVPQRAPPAPSQVVVEWTWSAPQSWPGALWEQIVSWGPALLVGFPIAGVILGLTAYGMVYWGWAVLIKRERRRRLQSHARR